MIISKLSLFLINYLLFLSVITSLEVFLIAMFDISYYQKKANMFIMQSTYFSTLGAFVMCVNVYFKTDLQLIYNSTNTYFLIIMIIAILVNSTCIIRYYINKISSKFSIKSSCEVKNLVIFILLVLKMFILLDISLHIDMVNVSLYS